MAVPDEPDTPAVVEADLGASPVGEVVGRERLTAEMLDPVHRRFDRFVCGESGLAVPVGEHLAQASSNPERLTGRLAPDRGRDRPDLILIERWSTLQSVGLLQCREDDGRWRPPSSHRARQRGQRGITLAFEDRLGLQPLR